VRVSQPSEWQKDFQRFSDKQVSLAEEQRIPMSSD
jgi:hypothetical protein